MQQIYYVLPIALAGISLQQQLLLDGCQINGRNNGTHPHLCPARITHLRLVFPESVQDAATKPPLDTTLAARVLTSPVAMRPRGRTAELSKIARAPVR